MESQFSGAIVTYRLENAFKVLARKTVHSTAEQAKVLKKLLLHF